MFRLLTIQVLYAERWVQLYLPRVLSLGQEKQSAARIPPNRSEFRSTRCCFVVEESPTMNMFCRYLTKGTRGVAGLSFFFTFSLLFFTRLYKKVSSHLSPMRRKCHNERAVLLISLRIPLQNFFSAAIIFLCPTGNQKQTKSTQRWLKLCPLDAQSKNALFSCFL